MDKTKSNMGFSDRHLVVLDSFPKVLLLLSTIGFMVYTSLRAEMLSMTHDESGSFYIWAEYDIFSCFVDPNCWKTANLHFLYVLLMKVTVGIFGVSELSIRMPSLIGHLIYMYFSWRLVRDWSDSHWMRLAGFFIMNCNPFLLEFFSLGRGYGLANAFMMASIFYTGHYFKTQEKSAAWGIFVSAFLAVMSNFTYLNFYACLFGALAMVFLFRFVRNAEMEWKFWGDLTIAGGAVTSVLFALVLMPVKALSSGGEFEFGGASFWDTFSSTVKASLYGVKYMHANHVEVLGGVLVLMLAAGTLMAICRLTRDINDSGCQFAVVVSLLPGLVALATVVQHYLLGVNYLRGRTALIFIPLASVALFFFLENVLEKRKEGYFKAIPVLIGLFCFVHVVRSFQFTHTYEWKYDAQTKEMVEYMRSIVPDGGQVKLGMHWYFHPATTFYFKYFACDFSEKLIYEKKYRDDIFYDYYYINAGDEKKVNHRYKVLKQFGNSGVLMVRDSLP